MKQGPDRLLELRHRRRARAEDRIRVAKDTGLTNLPLHDFAQNQIWCAIVALAVELTAWMQTLALVGHPARRWEPKRLRLRLFSIAGRLATAARPHPPPPATIPTVPFAPLPSPRTKAKIMKCCDDRLRPPAWSRVSALQRFLFSSVLAAARRLAD